MQKSPCAEAKGTVGVCEVEVLADNCAKEGLPCHTSRWESEISENWDLQFAIKKISWFFPLQFSL